MTKGPHRPGQGAGMTPHWMRRSITNSCFLARELQANRIPTIPAKNEQVVLAKSNGAMRNSKLAALQELGQGKTGNASLHCLVHT